jgi:DNA-binding CsgD family transcriptional regulator
MSRASLTARWRGQFTSQPREGRRLRELTGITDREREVLRLVGLGMSNAEIATALYITAGTAKTHVARLLAKLDARDRVQLVITAYEAGLVTAPHRPHQASSTGTRRARAKRPRNVPGCPGRAPRIRTCGRHAPAPSARQASRSSGPPAQPSPHPPFPAAPL